MRASLLPRIVLAGLLLISVAVQAESRPRIAVLAIEIAKGVDEQTVGLLDELLLTEMQEAGDWEIFGSSDIASMLSLEEQRAQVTGCADNNCLAEIGGALGVSLLVTSSLGAVGKKLLLNVKLLDVNSAKVHKRSSEVVAGEQEQLIGAIRRAVAKVTEGLPGTRTRPGEGAAAATATETETATATTTATGAEIVPGAAEETATPPGPDQSAAQPGESSGFLKVAPWLMLGLTVAAGGAGGAMLGIGQADKAELEDQVLGNDDWADTRDSAETKSAAGIALLGVAGAAAVATIVLFAVSAGGEKEPAATAAVIPVRGGAAASAMVRF